MQWQRPEYFLQHRCPIYSPKGRWLCVPDRDEKVFYPALLHSDTKAFLTTVLCSGGRTRFHIGAAAQKFARFFARESRNKGRRLWPNAAKQPHISTLTIRKARDLSYPEQHLVLILPRIINSTPSHTNEGVVIMLNRKVLGAGRNYEVCVTLDKKIIACQPRLLARWHPIIRVGACWSQEVWKTRRAFPSTTADY